MKKIKMPNKKKEMPSSLRYALCIAVGIAFSALLLSVGAFISLLTEDPTKTATFAAYAALVLSVLILGAVSGRLTENKALGSLICGVIFSAILFVISLFFEGKLNLPVKLTILLCVPLISALGGAVTSGRKRKNSAMARYKKLR